MHGYVMTIEYEIRMWMWRMYHQMVQSKPVKPVQHPQWHMQRTPKRVMRSVNRNSF